MEVSRRPVGLVAFGWFAGPSGRSGRKMEGMKGKIQWDCKEGRKGGENTGEEIWRRNKLAAKKITARCLNFHRGCV